MAPDQLKAWLEVVAAAAMLLGGGFGLLSGRFRAREAKRETALREAKKRQAEAEQDAEDSKELLVAQQINALSDRVETHFNETIRRFEQAEKASSSRGGEMIRALGVVQLDVVDLKGRVLRLEERIRS